MDETVRALLATVTEDDRQGLLGLARHWEAAGDPRAPFARQAAEADRYPGAAGRHWRWRRSYPAVDSASGQRDRGRLPALVYLMLMNPAVQTSGLPQALYVSPEEALLDWVEALARQAEAPEPGGGWFQPAWVPEAGQTEPPPRPGRRGRRRKKG